MYEYKNAINFNFITKLIRKNSCITRAYLHMIKACCRKHCQFISFSIRNKLYCVVRLKFDSMLQPMIGLMVAFIEACEHLSFSKRREREIIHSYIVCACADMCCISAVCTQSNIASAVFLLLLLLLRNLLRVNRKNNCAYAQFAFELLVIPFPCMSETRRAVTYWIGRYQCVCFTRWTKKSRKKAEKPMKCKHNFTQIIDFEFGWLATMVLTWANKKENAYVYIKNRLKADFPRLLRRRVCWRFSSFSVP